MPQPQPDIIDTPLAKVETAPLAVTAANSPILRIIGTAIEKGMDPDKLEKLYDLYEREQKRMAAAAFNAALACFQGECPKVFKTHATKASTKGFQYRFANLGDVLNGVGEAMGRNGLSRTWGVRTEDGKLFVVCYLRHADGHVDDNAKFPFTPDTGDMNAIQKIGSGNTYAERYTLLMALGIAPTDEDDDGVGTSAGPKEAVTEEQARTLNDLLIAAEEVSAGTRVRMLSWAGGAAIADVPASKFNEACSRLNATIKKGKP